MYMDQIFCYIETGQTDKVIEFFKVYPDTAKKFLAANNWTPAMYAARYGRQKLIQFLIENKFPLEGNSPYTLVHAACFGNECEMVKILIDTFKREPTPLSYEITPLRHACKYDNQQLVEILITRGAYYIYNDFHNNICEIQQQENTNSEVKFFTKVRKPDGNIDSVEIPQQCIFRVNDIKDTQKIIHDGKEQIIKEMFKWNRVQNYLMTVSYGNKNKITENEQLKENYTKFELLQYIASKRWRTMLEFLIGPKIL